MSNTYLSGEQTKRRILKESKKLFYKYGFTETTYAHISAAAKINRALIPYHFQTKQILGEEIYQRIIADFTQTMDELLDASQFSPDFIRILHTITYYRLLRDNPKLSRFVSQLLTDQASSLFTVEDGRKMLSELGNKFSLCDEDELNILAKMNIGMQKEIIQMIHTSAADIDRMAQIQLHMLMSYAGYSKKKANELINAAFEVADLVSFHVKNGFSIVITYN
ncbi:MAG: TetR/AcrR family transcriptional regulator [Lachnospiraceae bacterium]|nr:TetR/AcrR family transcriptional regulator [Lachnospiraceae bacterium]